MGAAAEATPNRADADGVVARILDGAGRAFVEHGVSGAGMREIAQHAGCSRATLYRHFENRHALHLAFVEDRALRLTGELRAELDGVEDPGERLTEWVMRAVSKVRGDPAMAAWFAPNEAGVTARMSRGSEVIAHLSGAFSHGLAAREGERLRSRYLVRMILSLLTSPAADEAEEREIVTRFVVPAVLAD